LYRWYTFNVLISLAILSLIMKIKQAQSIDADLQLKVFIHNLNRIYFAKCYLDKKMPNLIELASFKGLQLGIEEFWGDVKKQIKRMDTIYNLIDKTPSDENCNPLKEIVKDDFYLNERHQIAILNDIDIIMYIQLLEHINMVCYGLLKTISKKLKLKEAEQLLVESLDECVDNDQLFKLITQEYLS
jgi:ferritin-like metal-binding protein YciE